MNRNISFALAGLPLRERLLADQQILDPRGPTRADNQPVQITCEG